MSLKAAFVQLQTVLSAAAATIVESKTDLLIYDADLDGMGRFLPGSGWETAVDRLRQAVVLSQIPPAIIIMGSQAAKEPIKAGPIPASTAERDRKSVV